MKTTILFILALGLSLAGFAKAADSDRHKCALTVVALVKVKSGLEDEFKKNAHAILDPTRKEMGNISYNFHQSLTDKTVFDTFEQWSQIEDLDAHMNSEHMKAFFSQVGSYFAEGYPVIQTLKNIECGNGQ